MYLLLPLGILALPHVRDAEIISQLLVFFFSQEKEKQVFHFKVMLVLFKKKQVSYFISMLCCLRLNFLLVARYFLLVTFTCYFLLLARYFLLDACYILLVARYFLLAARYFFV